MFQQQKDWETRENAFAAFSMGPLTDFWRQREEAEFTGVDDIPVHFVRFHAEKNDRVIVVCPGRIESYVKYAELAYDLFHSGFDVLIIDHRGQGRSGRMLSDPHRGHVDNFNDYVDDLTAFWQQEVLPGPWRKRYILAHSMGGAIATLFLQRHPNQCDAIALCAPMFGIVMRFPDWMVRHILDWAEGHPRIREGYAMGTGRWRSPRLQTRKKGSSPRSPSRLTVFTCRCSISATSDAVISFPTSFVIMACRDSSIRALGTCRRTGKVR